MLIVKFNDYQCPPCRQTYEAYKPILAKYIATGQVKFVLKHFPLERSATPRRQADRTSPPAKRPRRWSWRSAKGTADKLEDWLFANQPPL